MVVILSNLRRIIHTFLRVAETMEHRCRATAMIEYPLKGHFLENHALSSDETVERNTPLLDRTVAKEPILLQNYSK